VHGTRIKKNPARCERAGSPTSCELEAGGPSQGEGLAAKSKLVVTAPIEGRYETWECVTPGWEIKT